MKTNRTPGFGRTPIALAIAVCFGSPLAHAHSASQTNRSGNPAINGGARCSGCHAGGSFAYAAGFSGSTTVAPASTSSFAFGLTRSSGAAAASAGFDLSASGGTLVDTSAAVQKIGAELTHAGPLAADGAGGFSWSFDWTAPATEGTYTLYACGLAADGTGGTGGDTTRCVSQAITVADPNPPPTITGFDAVASFVEGGAAVVVDGDLALADANDSDLNLAEMRLTDGYQAGEDRLQCPSLGVACSFDAATGTLTLAGAASLAGYQASLRAVTYRNTSSTPSTATRTVTLRVRDAHDRFSSEASTTLGVTAVEALAPVLLGPVQPLAREFRVNTTTAGDQQNPAVAVGGNGSFVVAWDTLTLGESTTYQVFARRYNRNGGSQGAEIAVTPVVTAFGGKPAVAMDAAGNFVVAWIDSAGMHAQRFDAAGAAQGAAIDFGASDSFHLVDHPDVAMDADGDFVMAAYGYRAGADNAGVYAQRYDASGAPQGDVIAVNTLTANAQWHPRVAMADAGNFFIAWTDTQINDVVGRCFDADGTPRQSNEFSLSTAGFGPFDPRVVADAQGDFVATWTQYGDGEGYGVYARRFNTSCASVGDSALVDTVTRGDQHFPDVGIDAHGNFVVAWQSEAQDGDQGGVYARRFGDNGAPLGGGFAVNGTVAGHQSQPRIAGDRDGGFVVVWQSEGTDGDGAGVYAQRFGFAPGLASPGDANANAAPDLAVLTRTAAARRLFERDGATGAPLAQPALDAGAAGHTLAVIPDFSGNGVAELAALGRRSDGTPQVEIVDAATGTLQSTTPFLGRHAQALRLAALPDLDGNGKPEVAVLGQAPGGAPRVMIKDVTTAALLGTFEFFDADHLAIAFAVLPDASGDARPELAVLAKDAVGGAISVQVRDGASGALLNRVPFFSIARTPIDLAVLADQDGNGRPELAVLAKDSASGAVQVQIRDSASDAVLHTFRFLGDAAMPTALAVVPDLDGSGREELAVLGHAPGSAPRVQVRDSGSGAPLASFGVFGAATVAAQLAVLPDLDGNGKPELAAVGTSASGVASEIRDAHAGTLIRSATYP